MNKAVDIYGEVDETLYKAFWNKLQQSQYDLVYYGEHFNRCTRISRTIKYVIIGATTLATSVWMSWNDLPVVSIVCAIVILIFQVVSAVSEWFPYEKRKSELRELSKELEMVYINMESDWRKIQRLQMTNKEITELMDKYAKKQADIKYHYFKDDALPERESIRKKADEKTEEYFKFFY